MLFAGRAVWLTGGSSGIGAAVAAELARRGARVAVTARTVAALEQVAAPLIADGHEVVVMAGDVTDGARMGEIAAALRERWGALDLAIFNAGTYEPVDPAAFSAERFRRHIDVNIMGVVNGIEAVLPAMLEERRGRIAVVSSVSGYAPLPRAAAYGASKAFLNSMTESLRADLADSGVAMTLVVPGFVRTPLTAQNDFPMPWLVEPEDAARIIVDGLEAGDAEIAFPRRMAWSMRTLGRAPGPIRRRWTARLARKRRDG